MVDRCFTNILVADVNRSATFYESVLGLDRHFDSDWFVILTHSNIDGLEFGLLERTHAIVPAAVQLPPAGVILTFVVDDCDAVFERATRAGAGVVEGPTDMPYGQRRALITDPDGATVDISSPISPAVSS